MGGLPITQYANLMGGGFSGGRAQLGVRTTKAVKRVGCSNLKQLVEDSKLIIEIPIHFIFIS